MEDFVLLQLLDLSDLHLAGGLAKFLLDAVHDKLTLKQLFFVVFQARLGLLEVFEEQAPEQVGLERLLLLSIVLTDGFHITELLLRSHAGIGACAVRVRLSFRCRGSCASWHGGGHSSCRSRSRLRTSLSICSGIFHGLEETLGLALLIGMISNMALLVTG